jgi:outer membrane lipoprotein-sorting protein
MRILTAILLFIAVSSASAFTADELIAKNIQARGGLEKIRAIQSLRETGKAKFGDRELAYTHLARRPQMVRDELTMQGLTSVRAYDGSVGWRISPFRGRIDPEKISGDDLKSVQLQADIEGPLVDYKSKGHKVEYLGTEDVDGTDAHKIKVTLKNGDILYTFLDPDYFLEIRQIEQTYIRGAQQETETDLGNYEQINGVYIPFSIESGAKGQPKDAKFTIEKAEANVDLDESLFHFPVRK